MLLRSLESHREEVLETSGGAKWCWIPWFYRPYLEPRLANFPPISMQGYAMPRPGGWIKGQTWSGHFFFPARIGSYCGSHDAAELGKSEARQMGFLEKSRMSRNLRIRE